MKTKTYYQVTYFSPGTLFSETSSFDFDFFDLKTFCKKAKEIKERYGATPFGFNWRKLEVPVEIPKLKGFKVNVEPKETQESLGTYFITGNIILTKDIPDDTKNGIWISNLENNNSKGVGIVNNNSYSFHGMFTEDDFILDWDGNIIRKGNDPDLVEYRKHSEERVENRFSKSLA